MHKSDWSGSFTARSKGGCLQRPWNGSSRTQMEPRAAIAQFEYECVCNIYRLNAKILAQAHQLANKSASRTNTNTWIYRIFQNDLLSLHACMHAGRQKYLRSNVGNNNHH